MKYSHVFHVTTTWYSIWFGPYCQMIQKTYNSNVASTGRWVEIRILECLSRAQIDKSGACRISCCNNLEQSTSRNRECVSFLGVLLILTNSVLCYFKYRALCLRFSNANQPTSKTFNGKFTANYLQHSTTEISIHQIVTRFCYNSTVKALHGIYEIGGIIILNMVSTFYSIPSNHPPSKLSRRQWNSP